MGKFEMCNRVRSISDYSEIPAQIWRGDRLNFDFNPNVAPTEVILALLAEEDGNHRQVVARFGIAMTGRDGAPRPALLNARTDGLRRGQFSRLLAENRCVVPCQGFYEWREEEGKQPYYFCRKDKKPMILACIWDDSEYKEDKRPGFAILTDEPNELIAPYHDRMPMALADDMVEKWLDLSIQSALDLPLLLNLEMFEVRPMDRRMNNVRQKDLRLIDPAAPGYIAVSLL